MNHRSTRDRIWKMRSQMTCMVHPSRRTWRCYLAATIRVAPLARRTWFAFCKSANRVTRVFQSIILTSRNARFAVNNIVHCRVLTVSDFICTHRDTTQLLHNSGPANLLGSTHDVTCKTAKTIKKGSRSPIESNYYFSTKHLLTVR